jgi:hypothetical protein
MNPSFSPRSQRRTACLVLLVWWFALASSWANACLVQDRGTHGHESPGGSSAVSETRQVVPGHRGADALHPENAGAAKGVCLKVCDEGTQSTVTQVIDLELPQPAMGPPLAQLWSAPLSAAAMDVALLTRPAPNPGVPLRTRFSRLAL